jgi:tRNA splicing endonuclease
MLCNVYSVLDEKRMYTKTGIKERAERIVYERG